MSQTNFNGLSGKKWIRTKSPFCKSGNSNSHFRKDPRTSMGISQTISKENEDQQPSKVGLDNLKQPKISGR